MGQILLLFYIPMANIPVSLKNIEEILPTISENDGMIPC